MTFQGGLVLLFMPLLVTWLQPILSCWRSSWPLGGGPSGILDVCTHGPRGDLSGPRCDGLPGPLQDLQELH